MIPKYPTKKSYLLQIRLELILQPLALHDFARKIKTRTTLNSSFHCWLLLTDHDQIHRCIAVFLSKCQQTETIGFMEFIQSTRYVANCICIGCYRKEG